MLSKLVPKMPARRQKGRGGGAQRGRGSRGGGGGRGRGVAAAPRPTGSGSREVRSKNLLLGDKSKSLILDLLHQLRVQEEEDAKAAGRPAPASVSGVTANSKTSSSSSAVDVSLEEMEMALLEAEEDEDADAFAEEEEEEEEEEGEELGQDGSFAAMANMLAGTKFTGDSDDDDEEEEEEEESEGEDDSDQSSPSSSSSSSSSSSTSGKRTKPKKPLSKHDQAMLLKALVKQDRESYVTQQLVAAVGQQQATTPPSKSSSKKGSAPSLKKKVRVTLCNGKGARKLVVVERRKDLQGFFAVANAKLKMKKPKTAILMETGEPLENTLLLLDDAVILVSDKDATTAAQTVGGSGSRQASSAADEAEEGEEDGAKNAEEKAAEMVASLDAVKEAYRRRNDSASNALDNHQAPSSDALAKESVRMTKKLQEKEASAEYQKGMFRQRSLLPAAAQREAILAAIAANQVVVVEGETGSGKTTQVPQFILDDWIAQGRGAECSILCTQPRRISAIGVAERVAAERMESVGKTVGYSIRLETRCSARTRLLFCTTGVLLRRLASDKDLAGVSHLLVDEVHERDLHTDFLLTILKDLLVRRPNLKVVLMSATVQASLFSGYFGGCPCLHIPGRTFPVQHLYLDAVEELLAAGGGAGSGGKRGGMAKQGRGRGEGGRGGQRGSRGGGGLRGKEILKAVADQDEEDDEGEDGKDADKALDEMFGKEEAKAIKAMASPPSDRVPIDYDLICRLTHQLVEQGQGNRDGGAILVFLPGLAEIERAISSMKRDPLLGDRTRTCLFALHSSVPTEAQRAVFKKMAPGVCKVVVSTNIAETSITIDDVVHVIDVGREKQMAYDPHTHMTSLREVWISQASAKQRAGRAGRVRPGTCYHLYEESFMEAVMPRHTLPEIRRMTLEDLILTVLLLELGPPQAFLERAIEPPSSKAVAASLKVLFDIEAIARGPAGSDRVIVLKPLGFHLASLPVDCRIGKMLVIAAIFDCVDPILTIAAAFSGKTPFVAPVGKRDEAQLAKQRFAESKSDHLALVALWKAWSHVKDEPWAVRKEFARTNYVSISALENMEAVRQQLQKNLAECGFAQQLPPQAPPSAVNYQSNEYDERLLKCVLLSGLTPQIAKLVRPTRGKGAHFVTKDPSAAVAIHPSSVNAKRIHMAGPEGREALAIYHRKVETSRLYLHDISFVSPLSLLLFGSNVSVSREHGGVASRVVNITVDGWLSFKTKEETSVLITVFKKQIDACLLRKITNPDEELVARFHPLVSTLRKLLQLEATGDG